MQGSYFTEGQPPNHTSSSYKSVGILFSVVIRRYVLPIDPSYEQWFMFLTSTLKL